MANTICAIKFSCLARRDLSTFMFDHLTIMAWAIEGWHFFKVIFSHFSLLIISECTRRHLTLTAIFATSAPAKRLARHSITYHWHQPHTSGGVHDIASELMAGLTEVNSAFHPSRVGRLYRVPACLAVVKAGCVHLCRALGNIVIPYDK